MKKFNITGRCFPKEHYMADVSKKLAIALKMIENEDYFIINRPRQYGKTTFFATKNHTIYTTLHTPTVLWILHQK
jgi:hypothetical protein